jgi:hypothetical protein
VTTDGRTAAELDPVSRVTARVFIIGAGVVSLAFSVALTANPSAQSQLSIPVLGVVAIALLVASYAFLYVSADPFGPVLSRARYQLFFAGVLSASVLNALSQFGSDTLIRDDWGAVCLGVALLVAAPYRLPREIVGFMTQAVTVSFTLAVVQKLTSDTDVELAVLVVVAAVPVLAIGLAAAAYARSLIASLEGAVLAAEDARRQHDDDVRRRLAESDSMGQLGALRADVVPFLERLERERELRPEDPGLATDLASALRLAIVQRLSQSSLADAVDDYSDEEGAAALLSGRQRAALRAAARAAAERDGASSAVVALTLERSAAGGRGRLELRGQRGAAQTASIMPFVRILKLVFSGVDIASGTSGTVITFRFDGDPASSAVSWNM